MNKYKDCQIKELPSKLRELAVSRVIESNSTECRSCTNRVDALEFRVMDFCWCDTPEGDTFWDKIYEGKIPKEYLEPIYELY